MQPTRDISMTDELTADAQPWGGVQTLAEHVGLSLGLTTGAAARFGLGVAHHLAAGRAVRDVLDLLDHPEAFGLMNALVEDTVLQASLSASGGAQDLTYAPFLESLFEALPCAVSVRRIEDGMRVHIIVSEPSEIERSGLIHVPYAVWTALEERAAQKPKGGLGGARLTET
jgi:hypothetical protein